MKSTIHISAAEAYETASHIAVVHLSTVLAPDQCLDTEQRRIVFEQVLPLVKEFQLDFDYLYLRYHLDGQPVLHECWTTRQMESLEPDSRMVLDGRQLWRRYVTPIALPSITL